MVYLGKKDLSNSYVQANQPFFLQRLSISRKYALNINRALFPRTTIKAVLTKAGSKHCVSTLLSQMSLCGSTSQSKHKEVCGTILLAFALNELSRYGYYELDRRLLPLQNTKSLSG